MERTVKKIEDLENRLRAFKAHEKGAASELPDISPDVDEEDEELADAFEVGKALKYQMSHLDVDHWLIDLAKDRRQLKMLQDQADCVTNDRDLKFGELQKIILEKVTRPSTNRLGEKIGKVVVFTAFADTASYLYENLLSWARDGMGVHIALVSGGARPNRTTLGDADYNQILINFAPRAKQRAKMSGMPQNEEISILIATDCISEGQNLQDSDLLVNYDIHWNPVRIIQRFGRIDRIGSLNKEIELINFWPTPDLNKYINLKNRVEARMALVDISATAEDNLLASTDIEELVRDDLKYRDRQLMRLKDEILDLDGFTESVDLTDFTLDDFRIALLNYITANRKLLEEAPLGLYAVVPASARAANMRPGVVFCLKQKNEARGADAVNPLQPFYLIYIYDSGDVRFGFAHPKQILEIFRDSCSGHTEPYERLCAFFDDGTNNGEDMTHYSDLLLRSVKSIVQQFNNRSLSQLLTDRSAKLVNSTERPNSADDFELISWLVVQNETSC
jgi:hypothetical protein